MNPIYSKLSRYPQRPWNLDEPETPQGRRPDFSRKGVSEERMGSLVRDCESLLSISDKHPTSGDHVAVHVWKDDLMIAYLTSIVFFRECLVLGFAKFSGYEDKRMVPFHRPELHITFDGDEVSRTVVKRKANYEMDSEQFSYEFFSGNRHCEHLSSYEVSSPQLAL
ncbi:hypothetical protein COLO4_07566 [Corchorus olitorius]|uniref:Uncharacterized protein n=1 Tax=Corchorus olitorius TaxID=93759 RepID=A0A1R3KJL1_9ROSI|nr:hypothetical protein COLO4_07566 [Corchorus olitorius]